jgi:hypothetical protein
MRSRVAVMSGIGLLVLLLTGCQTVTERAAERVIEGVAAGEGVEGVDLDLSGGRARIETADGVAEFGGGELPDSFPDLPLPDDAEILGVVTGDGDDGTMHSVTAAVPQGADDVGAFYDRELEARGWTVENRHNVETEGLAMRTYEVSGHGQRGAVQLMRTDDDATHVQIVLNEER